MTRIASGLSVGLFLVVRLAAVALPGHLGTGMVWHDNVTNAERTEDLLSALQWHTFVSTGNAWAFEGGHRLRASSQVRAEVWPRFEGLNLVAPGLTGAWEYKPGVGPNRPVFSAEGEGEWIAAHESDRGGWAGALRLRARQRIGDGWLLSAGQEWRRFDARGRAFARTGHGWFGRVEWIPGRDWSLAVEAGERVGDVVSYSRPPRPDLQAIGKPITFVDTFEQDAPWIAYYFRARTRSGVMELQRRLGRSSLTLRHEYRHTLHAGPGYRNRVTGIQFDSSF
jgi:hypothetical protein